jgi:hypothetical protein
MRAALFCLPLLLAACESNWIKPGATAADLEADRGRCEAEAREAAPVTLRMAPVASPATALNCGPGGTLGGAGAVGSVGPCTTTSAAGAQAVDANEPVRRRIVDQCLRRGGWVRAD